MKGKKILSLTAAVLAGVMLLSACGGGGNVSNETKSGVPVSGVNEFPIVEEPITLSIFCQKNASIEDITTNAFTKWYEEKTNVKIDWNLISGDVRQAINLQIASDDYSDIFQGFGFARSEQVAYYDQGVYIDISDLIEEHGYYIKEMFASEPDVEEKLRHTDNKIFGIPTVDRSFDGDAPYKMWVYKPWLDKLGAKIPETTEEFYQLLKRFKTEDPNGNGIADEIPLAARNARGGQIGLDMFIMNSFLKWGGLFLNDNGKAKFMPITDEAREGMRYMNKLYKEGLIHPDSFIMDRARVTALAENDVPILGAATGKWTTQFTVAGAASNRMNDFVAIPPLEGPGGVRHSLYGQSDPGCTHFSITTACENPAAAIKWIDWFYSEEAYLMTKATEGTRLAKEGELGLDGEQAKFVIDPIEGASVGDAIQNERWLSHALGYWPRENSLKTKVNTIDATRQANAYEAYKLYDPYVINDSGLIGDFPVPSDVAEEYLELRANFASAVDSGFVSFVIGEKDIETEWDAYVDNFYKLGLERYTEIIQDYIDTLK